MVSFLNLLVVLFVFGTVAADLEVLYEWKYIDYVWKSKDQKLEAIEKGKYNASKIFAIDVQSAPDGRVFVTTPKQDGVPASLSTISNERGEGGPLLEPYPDWSWHCHKKNCSEIITSVYRVTIDDCNRLWVLDTGKYDDDQICEPQMLAFDLSTNELVRRVKISRRSARSATNPDKGLLITPVVDVRKPFCDKMWIYMADVDGWGLLMSNGKRVQRLTDKSFEADQRYTNFTIAGESFQLQDGLFTLALRRSPYIWSSRLFYRPLASVKQYYVTTGSLRQTFRYNSPVHPDYKTLDYTFPSQISMQAISEAGVLFMGVTDPPAIACWNTYKPMTNENVVIVASNYTTLQFTSGMKVQGNELWVLTNRYQKLMTGTRNLREINFRILVERDIDKLVKGTSCKRSSDFWLKILLGF